MARNYVTGRWELPDGPVPGVGGVEQLDIADTQSLRFGDNEVLYFGDAFDVGIKWNGSNLLVLPVADHTGQILIGNGVLSMDVKAFGSSSGNYVWWMSDADALYLYITSKTVTGEDHALDITFNGTVAAGADQMVGLNVAVVPAGAHGGWASAIYGQVTMPAGGRPIDGYVSAAELEVIHTAGVAVQCAYYILNLNENNGGVTVSAVRAYIGLNDYSVAAYRQPNLFHFKSAAGKVTPADDDVILTEPGVVLGGTFNVAVRNLFGATPFWLLGTTTTPETFADLKMMGSVLGNYMEWDASADKFNLVVPTFNIAAGTTYAAATRLAEIIGAGVLPGTGGWPTQTGGLEGLRISLTPTGSGGNRMAGIYSYIHVTGTGDIFTGAYYAGEFHVDSDAAGNQSTYGVIQLKDSNDSTVGGAHPARCFIRIRSDGAVNPLNLFSFVNEDSTSLHDSGRMIVETDHIPGVDDTTYVQIRCLVNDIPIWLIATKVAPVAH